MDITNMEAMEAEEFNMVMVVGVVKVMTAVRVVKMDRKELCRVEVRVGVGVEHRDKQRDAKEK